LLCTEEIVYKKMIQWADQQCRKEQNVTANKKQHVTGNDGQRMTANDEHHVTANDEEHVTGNDEQRVNGNKEQHVTSNDEQLRKVLGDLIYLIRFPIMKRKYFSNEVSRKNVLTLEEKVEIFQSF